MNRIIAIDPGSKKCGLVLVDKSLGIVLDGKVVKKDSVLDLINFWQEESSVDLIVLGNGTSSDFWEIEIKSNMAIRVRIVEEKNTTLRARNRYWELWPKNFLLSLIPKGMLLPPGNLDAVAALVLLEDFLNMKLNWIEKIDFKTWPEQ